MPVRLDTSASAIDPRKTQMIVDHVQLKWKLEQCALCAGTEFAVYAQVTLRFFTDPKTIAGPSGELRPSAAITCTTCGNALILDLLIAGVYRRVTEEPATPPTGPYR